MPWIDATLQYTLWIAGNLAFLIPLYGLAKRFSSLPSRALVQSFILYIALIQATVFLLALVGKLAPLSLLLCAFTCAAVLWTSHHKLGLASSSGERRIFTLSGDASASALLLLGLFIAFCLLALLRASLFGDTTTDGLWYHVPRVYGLHQEQSLASLGHPFVDASHPKGPEFWFYWNFSLFRSAAFTVPSLLPFLVLALAAAYALGRSFGASPGTALIGALTAGFAPVVAGQLGTTYTDIMTAALIVAALALILSPQKGMSSFDRVCLALCFGLILNSKLSALVTVPILGALYLYVEWRRETVGMALKRALPMLALAALLGGYTYLDNFLSYGNPIYPQDFRLGPLVFEGPAAFERMWEMRNAAGEAAVIRALRTWLAAGELGYASIKGGYGVVGLLLSSTLIAAAVVSMLRRDIRNLGPLLVVSALLYFSTPLFFVARFGLFILFVAGACLAAMLQLLPRASYIRTALIAIVFLAGFSAVAQQLRALEYHHHSHRGLSSTCPAYFPSEYLPVFESIHAPEAVPQTWLVVSDLNPIALACFWDPALRNRVYFLQLEGQERTLSDVRAEAMRRQATRILIPQPLAAGISETASVVMDVQNAVVVDDRLYKLHTEN